MQHYYVTGPEQIEAIEEPIPTPGDNEVVVRLAYTALSPGSNIFVYRTGSYTGHWDGGGKTRSPWAAATSKPLARG